MTSDLKKQVGACATCLAKQTRMKTNAGVHHPVMKGHPQAELHIDLVGPLPETPDQKMYILTMEDAFTRMAHSVPIPNKNAATVVNALLGSY